MKTFIDLKDDSRFYKMWHGSLAWAINTNGPVHGPALCVRKEWLAGGPRSAVHKLNDDASTKGFSLGKTDEKDVYRF